MRDTGVGHGFTGVVVVGGNRLDEMKRDLGRCHRVQGQRPKSINPRGHIVSFICRALCKELKLIPTLFAFDVL